MAAVLTIPKNLTHGDELIVVRRKDYDTLKRHLTEVQDALFKIRLGEKELKEGKTRIVRSLAQV